MESINKNMPLISCIIGLGILLFSILHFIGGVRTELKTDMAQVKSELKADVAQVRGEVKEVRTELKAEIIQVKNELKADIKSIETNIKSINEKLGLLLQAQRKPASTKIKSR